MSRTGRGGVRLSHEELKWKRGRVSEDQDVACESVSLALSDLSHVCKHIGATHTSVHTSVHLHHCVTH